MFSLREFEGEARRSREMLSLQVTLVLLFIILMILILPLQVKEAKALLASQARQNRALLEEVPYHHSSIFTIFPFNLKLCPSWCCHFVILAGKTEYKVLRKVG